jgi:hypothetical protein
MRSSLLPYTRLVAALNKRVAVLNIRLRTVNVGGMNEDKEWMVSGS